MAKSAQKAADRVNSQMTKLPEVVKVRVRSGQRLKSPEIEVSRVKLGFVLTKSRIGRDRSGQKLRWPQVPRHSDGKTSEEECAERPLVGNVRLS